MKQTGVKIMRIVIILLALAVLAGEFYDAVIAPLR
jgi:hypothetical protein